MLITSACVAALWLPVQLFGAEDSALVDLRTRFVPGRTAVYGIVTDKTIAVTDSDQPPIHSRVAYTLHQRVLQSARNHADIELRLDRIVTKSTAGQTVQVDFDSSAPRKDDESPGSALLRDAVGKRFVASLDQHGKVLSLRAADRLSARLVKDQRASEAAQIVGEEQLRNLVRAQFSWLPNVPIAIGGDWSREETLPLGFVDLVRRNAYRLADTNDGVATVYAAVELLGRATAGVEEEGARIVGSVQATTPGTATYQFHVATGILLSLDSDVAFDLRIDRHPKTGGERPVTTLQRLSAKTQFRLLALDGRNFAPLPDSP